MGIRLWFYRYRTLGTSIGAVAALACGCGESQGVDNSQTGSLDGRECLVDADCGSDLTVLTEPLGNVELVGAACDYPASSSQPACNCQLRKTPYRASEEPYVYSAWAGTRPGGCSQYGRVRGCVYCESEFPGCDVNDDASCDSICQDLTHRNSVEFAQAFSARVRINRCSERYTCTTVLEVEGNCYVGSIGAFEPRAYDCSASDEELLAQPENAWGGNSCENRAGSHCESAADCRGGLACNQGMCTACDQSCLAGDDTCVPGGTCAVGESCAGGTCVRDANVTCRSDLDCEDNQRCVSSGIDWTAARGNEGARSFCR